MPTSIIVVDGTNLDHRLADAVVARGGQIKDIDYLKFFAELAGDSELLQVHYCSAPYKQSSDPIRREFRARQARTFNRLAQIPNMTIHNKGRHKDENFYCGTCRKSSPRTIEKGTDVSAASRLVHAACKGLADRLILIANDNDYVPALELCREEGANLTLGYVTANLADSYYVGCLRKLVHNEVPITPEFMEPFWLEKPAAKIRQPTTR